MYGILKKKQLLIDSLLNDFDIPKIYFHSYSRNQDNNADYSHSVIDGRQRLEAIWDFIEGKFSLADDFVYLRNNQIQLNNLTYKDIATDYIDIRIDFDSVILPIIEVITDDIDLIEEMFSRLNDGEPLNAAEKRNAFTGAVTTSIRTIIQHNFFTEKVKFPNTRYKHQDIAAKILFTEFNLLKNKQLINTNKAYLDKFVKEQSNNNEIITIVTQNAIMYLDDMSNTFIAKDDLLKAQGNIVLYYLLFRNAKQNHKLDKLTRANFLKWRKKLSENKTFIDENIDLSAENQQSALDLLEFNRLSQQGTNNSSNIRDRYNIIAAYFGIILENTTSYID